MVAGLEVRHGVVPALAVLPGEAVADVAVAVALAPHALAALRGEESSLAPLAAESHRVPAAVDAHGLVPLRMQTRPPQPFRVLRNIQSCITLGQVWQIE